MIEDTHLRLAAILFETKAEIFFAYKKNVDESPLLFFLDCLQIKIGVVFFVVSDYALLICQL